MAKSPTPKNKKNRRAQPSKFDPELHSDMQMIDEFTSIAAEYVKQWAKKKASDLSSQDRRPLIFPLPNGYRVGKLSMINAGGQWLIKDCYNETRQVLNFRRSALVYCVYEHLGDFLKSREIKLLDDQVTKLEIDLIHYTNSLAKALKDKNASKVTILDARIAEAKLWYNQRKDLLKKSLNSAKYLKVWDKQQ